MRFRRLGVWRFSFFLGGLEVEGFRGLLLCSLEGSGFRVGALTGWYSQRGGQND